MSNSQNSMHQMAKDNIKLVGSSLTTASPAIYYLLIILGHCIS